MDCLVECGDIGERLMGEVMGLQIVPGFTLLSRDSRLGQRIDHSLLIKVIDGRVDRLVERVDVGEGLMGEVMRLQIVPDDLDIIEFGRIFGQPLNGEPVCPGGERHA